MTLYAFCLAPSLFYSMHLLEESPERLWDGGVQLKKSTSVFCQYISVQSSPVYSTLSHQWGWYLTFTWHCKVSSSLNSESSGRNTHSKTVTSKFYPLYFSCLFFHTFKHGWLWKSEKKYSSIQKWIYCIHFVFSRVWIVPDINSFDINKKYRCSCL